MRMLMRRLRNAARVAIGQSITPGTVCPLCSYRRRVSRPKTVENRLAFSSATGQGAAGADHVEGPEPCTGLSPSGENWSDLELVGYGRGSEP